MEPALALLIALILLGGAGATLLTAQGRSWSRAWTPRFIADRSASLPESTGETTSVLAQRALPAPARDALDDHMLTSPAALMPKTPDDLPSGSFATGTPTGTAGEWDAFLGRVEQIEASIAALGRASADRELARESEV
ncbi:MAG TPA: hypothetical protein VFP10_10920, partial [Candidatus Eisenbacteria bacterium]|nr:hypothetical protein [Candidatus Eisenbacteria bacterium]